jgi:hypothetical protein
MDVKYKRISLMSIDYKTYYKLLDKYKESTMTVIPLAVKIVKSILKTYIVIQNRENSSYLEQELGCDLLMMLRILEDKYIFLRATLDDMFDEILESARLNVILDNDTNHIDNIEKLSLEDTCVEVFNVESLYNLSFCPPEENSYEYNIEDDRTPINQDSSCNEQAK